MDSLAPFFGTFGKIFGIFIGIFVVFVAGLFVYVDIWLKFHVRGKVTAIFVDNRSIFSALLTIEDGNKLYYGKGDKKEEYLLDDKKQYLTLYPAGLPRILQITIRAYWYSRNQSMPIDPTGKPSPLTAKMLRMISDEAMVRQTWRDVREAQGLNKGKASNLALYLVIGCLGLGALNLYLIMTTQSTVKAIQAVINKAFGVGP